MNGAQSRFTIYPAYLLCLGLMLPAFALTALFSIVLLLSKGVGSGLWSLLELVAFFGEGIGDPLHSGWRILALLGVIGFLLSAGAIQRLRTVAFHGLGILGTICVAFCLLTATREGSDETFSTLVFLAPSLIGIAASVWFAMKFRVASGNNNSSPSV